MDAYKALCAEAEQDYEGFWARHARELVSWKQPFTQVLDSSNAPFFKWFADGKLNVSYNCLDRQVEAGLGDKVAIVFEADNGEVTKVTYKEMLVKVCKMANLLKSKPGVKKGDRVVIYLPMTVEGIVAMQACARVGAIHSVVFGGFSAQSLRPHQRRRRRHAHHLRRPVPRRQVDSPEADRRRSLRHGRLRLLQERHRLQAYRRRLQPWWPAATNGCTTSWPARPTTV